MAMSMEQESNVARAVRLGVGESNVARAVRLGVVESNVARAVWLGVGDSGLACACGCVWVSQMWHVRCGWL